MTVGELIELLKKLPSDLPVVTPGFDESGFESPAVEVVQMFQFPENRRYRSSPQRDSYKDESRGDVGFTQEPEPKPVTVAVINYGD